jgi:hypothetical protein
MKLRTLFCVSVLLTPAGCDQQSAGSCDAFVSDAFRGKSLNGKSLNGKSLNGEWLNGKSLNGKSLNGVSLVGVELADELADVELVGTALVGTDHAGDVIVGQGWVGAVIPAQVGDERIDLRIAAVEPDATDATIEWYVLEYEGESICGEGGRGLFVGGVWDESGARHESWADADDISHTFSCETGVLAKCVEWGYAQHTAGVAAHQTCTRMARADYCGSGEPHTVDGTVIDVFDTLGVQQSDASLDLAFEAGWGPDGALCVSQPRWLELASDGEEIAVSCWEQLPACDTAEDAIAAGATLMNRSAPQTLCHE